MKKTVTYLFASLLLVCHYNTRAQYNNLIGKKYPQRVINLYKIYGNVISAKDTIAANIIVSNLRTLAIKNNDKELEIEADFIKALDYEHKHYNQFQKGIKELQKVAVKAQSNNYEVILPKIYRVIGEAYWEGMNNYELAFENYYKMLKVQNQFTDLQCPDKALNFVTIGNAFYFFNDCKSCINNMRKALDVSTTDFSVKQKNTANNTIGLIYQQMGKLDSADFYFQRIINLKENYRLKEWIAISKGNLGYNKYLRGKYTEALPLMKEDVDQAILSSDYGLATTSLVHLAETYLKLGKNSEAEETASKAIEYARKSKEYRRWENLYPLLAKINIQNQNKELAKFYLDSAITVKDSLRKKFSALQLLRVNQKLDRETQIKLNNEKQRKTAQRNYLIVLILILVVLSLYVYFNQKKNSKQKQLIHDLKLKQMNGELNNATLQLKQFTEQINNKRKLVKDLESKLNKQDNNELLNQLQESTILTDEEWEQFRKLFEKVHSGFLIRLKEKLPNLSPAEIRFMTLAKLKFDNKEMASTLGVSPESIRVTRYRLRKKINLPEDGDLEELVNMV